MSTSDSPVIQPLHHPAQAAKVSVPQAPLGNATNAFMGTKALLAKKLSKTINPTYISPTDSVMTPCTKKISAAKKKHFTKSTKPLELLPSDSKDEDDESAVAKLATTTAQHYPATPLDDDENPF